MLFEMERLMPWHEYIFLGDNARAPYGDRPLEALQMYTEEALDFLFRQQHCDAVVIACNTLSATTLEFAQTELGYKHVYGVLQPTAEYACHMTSNHVIGVIATRATSESGSYESALTSCDKSMQVYSKSTPLLVPLIEEGRVGKRETNIVLKNYLRSFKDKHIDTLILGCTHYPLLENDVRRIMGKHVAVVSSPHPTAVALMEMLPATTGSAKKGIQFFTTGCPKRFATQVYTLFGKKLSEVKKHTW